MRHAFLAFMAVPLFIFVSSPRTSLAFDFPDKALQLIAEANADPCSICGEKKLKEAFAVMNTKLVPGMIIDAAGSCGLMKRDTDSSYELSLACYPSTELRRSIQGEMLPDFVFSFYTLEKKLVGIADEDCTKAGTVEVFRAAPPGTVFEGKVRLIPYSYGDGPTFNYFPQANKVQIHCVLLELKQLNK